MEYNLCKKSMSTVFPLLDTVSEQPVDLDLTLPDYCPDIERILRCTLIPKVYLSNVSGDRLTVEGAACVRIVYFDGEKGSLRSFEHTALFSESFALKDSPADCCVYVDTKPEYLNCRALSPRKLSLHGAFSLYARAAVKQPLVYYGYEDEDDLQVRTGSLPVSQLSGLCCDMFGVTEDIPMSGRPGVSAFIGYRCEARITELRAIGGKILLTAEGSLELMYLSDHAGNDIEYMTHSFPISRVIDCAGADESAVIEARLDLMSYDLKLNDDALDGSGVLALDLKLCFNALCWHESEIALIDDVFSTQREVQARMEPFNCRCGVRRLDFTDTAKSVIAFDGEQIRQVIRVGAEQIAVSAAISGGAPLLSSKLTVGIVYVNGDGEIRWVDRDIAFDYNPTADGYDCIDCVTADIYSLSYRIIDDRSLELRAEIGYHMTVSRRVSRQTVASVSTDDNAEAYTGSDALILYYADKGEDIWQIAKRYHSRPADIIAENELESDVLGDDAMLMIADQ